MSGTDRCLQYVEDVLDGRLCAPKTIIQACERFVRDCDRPDIEYDPAAADRAVHIIEGLPHTKGRWQRKPITLENWQCFIVCNLFGWKWVETGLRRFKYCYKQVPRKNGKSLLAVMIALVMFGPDREPGAEVYLGATGQAQARDLLFKPSKFIVQNEDEFREAYGIEVNAQTLVIPENGSTLQTVIKKPDDGASPHCAIVDEYHEHDTDEQYETFATGLGAREQPLLLVTTTAGSNLGGPCKEMHDDCKRILDGSAEDDSTFVVIYEPDEDDEWDSVETLRKVNPNIGVSVSEEYLLDQLSKARRSASKQSSYRTKHLNQWVGAKTVWMNQLAWQAAGKKLKQSAFAGAECFITVDLTSKTDLAVIAATFRVEDRYTAFTRHYAPEETVADNDKYRKLALAGCLVETPGNVTDQAFIEADILEWCEQFDVLGLGYDPWQANYLATRLMDEGVECVEYRHTIANMSEPMKELEALVLQKKYTHANDQALSWCMANVMARMDEKGNIYPVKERKDSPNKIDGAVAAIMGVGMWLQHTVEVSPYEERGVRVI